jgi:hypothetical protein
MDRPRQLLLLTCTALARLQQDLLGDAVRPTNAEWYGRVRDLKSPSAWLDGMPDNFAVSGALHRIMQVQTHLLAMIGHEEAIDELRACLVLQSIGGYDRTEGWSMPVRRLAAQLEIALPHGPRSLHYGRSLADLPATALPPARIPRALPKDSLERVGPEFKPTSAMLGTASCNHATSNKKSRRKASDFAKNRHTDGEPIEGLTATISKTGKLQVSATRL